MRLKNFIKKIFHQKTSKKVALCLGSGGAKGAALIGAIKAFEEEGIKFDMVAGTSIGAIVGCMYALGFSADKMLNVLKDYKLYDRKKLLSYTLRGITVEKLLTEILGKKQFCDTNIPFRAVACDIVSGEEVVMHSGSLPKALAASSAIPPVFRPVKRMSRKLVDGAFVNSVPADVAKSMGADLIISVALGKTESNKNIKKTADILYKSNGIKICNRLRQLKVSDHTIFPDLKNYKSSSVKSLNEIYLLGYKAAIKDMKKIKLLFDTKGIKYRNKRPIRGLLQKTHI